MAEGTRMHDTCEVAVYFPKLTPAVAPKLPPLKVQHRGTWMKASARISAELSLTPTCPSFTLQLQLNNKALPSHHDCLSVNLFDARLKLLAPSSLLLHCPTAAGSFKGVVAIKFSSTDTFQALKTLLQAAVNFAQPHNQQDQLQDAEMRDEGEQGSWASLQGASDARLRELIEGYIVDPKFMAFKDRVEGIWNEMLA